MEEHIFGTYATDELKVVHHRAARRGMQHWHDIEPADPLPGDAVTVRVRVGPDMPVNGVALYYTTDGTIPQGRLGVATHGEVLALSPEKLAWDNVVWGYVETWVVTLPAQPEDTTVRYRISGWNDEREIFANWPDPNITTEIAAAAFFRGDPLPDASPGDPDVGTTFTYIVDRVTAPQWAHDAIMYQIMPDRFYPGNGKDWLQTDDVIGFCGGTLRGILEKLDYIEALGITAIWMTPIFPSPSHHGYDTTDYRTIEPRLGTEDDLRELVEAAHSRGIRVILDLVCNHMSHLHPVFLDALNNVDSPYRDWFTFNDSEVGYRSFFGVVEMPQLNLQNPDARDWMLDIAAYWLREFDVDGYRLDYALGPGPDFWSDFRAACKRVKPDSFVFGEIVDSPKAVGRYVGRLDGNLDFIVETTLRRAYAYDAMSEDAFNHFMVQHLSYFPKDFILPTFLDNHDTDRFLYLVGGDKDKLRRAATVQMKLPGPPIIYYGTEVGLSQNSSKHDGLGLEVSREVMPWGDAQDEELLGFYKDLIAERKNRQ